MAKRGVFKPAIICVGALVLAIAVGIQAAATVATRTQPAAALQIDPNNGEALGKYAYVVFGTAAKNGTEVAAAARQAEPYALKAYKQEPLGSQALAILAMTQQDAAKKQAVLEQSLKLNRRSLPLQGLALQMHVEKEDFPAAVTTLDQILRVHPERSQEFFPVLTQALAREEVIPSFVEILAGTPPWQDRFLNYTVGQKIAVVNTAKLRRKIVSTDERIDSVIIANLSRFGELEEAQQHYQFATRDDDGQTPAWPMALPPLDWDFADDREMRAQVSRDGKEIEIYVKSGSGGLLMERLFEAPRDAFTVSAKFDIRPTTQAKDVRLQVTCLEPESVLIDKPLSEQKTGFQVAAPSPNCEFVKVGIYARSWRGRPALRGSIQSLEIGAN